MEQAKKEKQNKKSSKLLKVGCLINIYNSPSVKGAKKRDMEGFRKSGIISSDGNAYTGYVGDELIKNVFIAIFDEGNGSKVYERYQKRATNTKDDITKAELDSLLTAVCNKYKENSKGRNHYKKKAILVAILLILEKKGGGHQAADGNTFFDAVDISLAIHGNKGQQDNIRELCAAEIHLFTTITLKGDRAAPRGHVMFSVNLKELDIGFLLSSFNRSAKTTEDDINNLTEAYKKKKSGISANPSSGSPSSSSSSSSKSSDSPSPSSSEPNPTSASSEEAHVAALSLKQAELPDRAAQEFGFQRKKEASDGDCFYHAISYQLATRLKDGHATDCKPIIISPTQLRCIGAAYLRANPGKFGETLLPFYEDRVHNRWLNTYYLRNLSESAKQKAINCIKFNLQYYNKVLSIKPVSGQLPQQQAEAIFEQLCTRSDEQTKAVANNLLAVIADNLTNQEKVDARANRIIELPTNSALWEFADEPDIQALSEALGISIGILRPATEANQNDNPIETPARFHYTLNNQLARRVFIVHVGSGHYDSLDAYPAVGSLENAKLVATYPAASDPIDSSLTEEQILFLATKPIDQIAEEFYKIEGIKKPGERKIAISTSLSSAASSSPVSKVGSVDSIKDSDKLIPFREKLYALMTRKYDKFIFHIQRYSSDKIIIKFPIHNELMMTSGEMRKELVELWRSFYDEGIATLGVAIADRRPNFQEWTLTINADATVLDVIMNLFQDCSRPAITSVSGVSYFKAPASSSLAPEASLPKSEKDVEDDIDEITGEVECRLS